MAQGTRSLRRGELLAILGEIYRDKETGTLVLQQGQVSKFLYAQEGNLIFAASNSPEDKFTQILIDQGKLTNEQLAMAQDKKESRTIGRTLVELGFLASEDLLDALVSQMRKIASSVLNWESGFAAFKPGILPPNLAKLPIATPRFIVDTALTLADREWAAASLGRLEIPIQMDESHREMAKGLNPTADEMRLLGMIDGNRTARQTCLDADVNLFDGVRFLIGLYYLGWIVLEQAVVAAPPPGKPKETVDLSFLDKVAPVPPAAHPVGDVPVTPQRLKAPPKASGAAPEPSDLPFEIGQDQGELKTSPEPLPSPPPASSKAAPRPPAEEAPAFVPPAAVEPVSRPDLLPPLGEEEEEEEEEEALPPEKPAVKPLTFTALHRPEPKPWGMILGILAGVVVLGAALAVAGWWFFLRPKPQPLSPTKPPVVQPTTPKPAEPKPEPAPGPVTPANRFASEPVAPKPAEPKPPQPKPPEPKPEPVRPPPPEPKPEPAPVGAASLDEGRRLLEGGQYRQAALTFQRALSSKRGGFTINVEVACQDETVAKGLAAAGADPAFIILPYNLKGRSCYRVIWGHYPDRASAEEAMRGLPEFFKHGASPQVAAWK